MTTRPVGRVLGPAQRRLSPSDERGHPVPQRQRGVEQEEVNVATGRDRGEHLEIGRPGKRVRPNSETRTGISTIPGSSRRRSHAPVRRSAGLGPADRFAQAPPEGRLPDGVGWEWAAVGAGVTAGGPGPHHRRPVHAVAVEQVGDVPDAGEAAGLVIRSRCRVDARPAEPATARRGRRRRLRPAARPIARGPSDRCPGRFRRRPPTRGLTRVPGNGKSMLAHTPSPRPGVAPRRVAKRWLNQRSTPRVGTATTSAVIGSCKGTATRSPSMSTRGSARSAR